MFGIQMDGIQIPKVDSFREREERKNKLIHLIS